MLHVGERVKVHIGVLVRKSMGERPLGSPWSIFRFHNRGRLLL